MRELLAGMSPRLGVSQVPRALPVGLHNLTKGQSMGCYHQRETERNQAFARREDEDCSVVPVRLKSDRG